MVLWGGMTYYRNLAGPIPERIEQVVNSEGNPPQRVLQVCSLMQYDSQWLRLFSLMHMT